MTARQAGVVSVAVLTIFAAGISPAEAYLDPGTGSMILQGLIGAVAGGLVLLKIYWRRIKLFFSSKRAGKSVEDGNLDQN